MLNIFQKKVDEPKEVVSSCSSPIMGRGKLLSMLQKTSHVEASDDTQQSTDRTSRDKSSDEQRGTLQSFGDSSRPSVSKCVCKLIQWHEK